MNVDTFKLDLSKILALPESELVRKGLLALIAKEIRQAELEVAGIRERYDVFSKDALYEAIQNGSVAGHPAWEDYIIWKNKETHIENLRQLAVRA